MVTHHFFDSSYFNVLGIDTRAESIFLKEPDLTLHSICRCIKLPNKNLRASVDLRTQRSSYKTHILSPNQAEAQYRKNKYKP